MVKPKKRQLAALPAKNNGAPSDLISSVNMKTDVDLLGEDCWVIVKKQRVTILVPPLPVAKQSQMPNPGLGQPQAHETTTNRQQVSSETNPLMDPVLERERSTSIGPKMDIQVAPKLPSAQPVSTSIKQPRLYFGKGSEKAGVGTFKPRRLLGPDSAAKAIKRPTVQNESIKFPIGSVSLNQRMRALNLERKLQRAGGLSRWLALLGLGQFVQIFKGNSIDKFQLVNMTMKKLKDMGADAVGPRRKLIHAIDCLCQPYCFEAL